jgi:hypothetical protein
MVGDLRFLKFSITYGKVLFSKWFGTYPMELKEN